MNQVPPSLAKLNFDNRFTRELRGDEVTQNARRKVRAAYSRVLPTSVAKPTLIAYSREVGDFLGLDEPASAEAATAFAETFGGNSMLPGMDPFAMCYGGHQFGNWAGQLGDGRAINLGEVVNAAGEHWTLQLKGAGPTPYSRTADGLAVLRSSIREFLCSEAMFHLGVPTTRALSLVGTGELVRRDMFYDGNAKHEPGAVVCRVAPSFVRFGNFELPSSRRDFALLRQLVDNTIRWDFPELVSSPEQHDPARDGQTEVETDGEQDAGQGAEERAAFPQSVYAAWFAEVCRRTANMIVHWMRVGFVHGVMNTDNMSILGLTIDYGPYGWLEDFDPGWTPNTTDAEGRRYRFGQQPQIAAWNLSRLANALAPLMSEKPTDSWIADLEAGLAVYSQTFNDGWNSMMTQKLGLQSYRADVDDELFQSLMSVLQAEETDMTIFYRRLADVRPAMLDDDTWFVTLQDAYYAPEKVSDDNRQLMSAWLKSYLERVAIDGTDDELRRQQMHAVNPKFVMRNYLAQLAIDKAEAGDYSLVTELLDVMRNPYAEQPDREEYALKRPEWARHRAGCSMLSCSS